MSKIRTLDQLSNHLDGELSWRKQELSSLKAMIGRSQAKTPQSRLLLRSGITVLYAHWEGFIKAAASGYLEYVAVQRLTYNQLTSNFIALAFKQRLEMVTETHKPTVYTENLNFIRSQLSERSQIPHKDVIQTGSNLSSSVLKEIICVLGLDYSPYELKQRLIDTELLAKRNAIAHGEHLEIDSDDYGKLHNQVITMMDDFKTQIENSASQKLYRSP
ncbi:MAE_28990/MAE_18760 family HEPN-like nuclease [Prochlorothrix hollandica]|uniref:MAE_28990/MAE_18760 family HEPN-like nuclease n=1 Tax=Prochlorothrix hollandica TaxID=1223 RepID=UPI00333E2A36